MSKQSSRGASWEALRLRILKRDNYTCAYCQGEATTVDHVIAKDNGGTDDPGNLVAACLACNGRKSNRVLVRMPYVNTRWLTSL